MSNLYQDGWEDGQKQGEENMRPEIERLKAELEQTNEAHGVLVEECGRLRAALQMIVETFRDSEGFCDCKLIARETLGVDQQEAKK